MKRIAVLLVAAMLAGCAGTNFSWDEARKVKVGMTSQQVQAIMGRPYMISTTAPGETKWVWSYADGFGTSRSMSVVFDGDTVVSVPAIPASF